MSIHRGDSKWRLGSFQVWAGWLALGFLPFAATLAGEPDADGDGVPDAADACPRTPLGTPVDAQGRPIGDLDGDCDTDLDDVALLLTGYTGPLQIRSDAAPGELVIVEVMQDPAFVTDPNGEWFEIVNVTNRPISLAGLTFTDGDRDSFTVPLNAEAVVGAGGHFVLGRNGDPLMNGGVTVDYEYSGMSLGNVDDAIIILNRETVIDMIAWDGGTKWPDPTGASMILDGLLDPAAVDNNDPVNWCISSSPIGLGDLGTPGDPNDTCP